MVLADVIINRRDDARRKREISSAQVIDDTMSSSKCSNTCIPSLGKYITPCVGER